MLEIPVILARR